MQALNPQELDALLTAGGPEHRLWLLLGADAGLRNTEIRTLSPDMVLPSGLIHVRGKGGKKRQVPATPRLLQAIYLEDTARIAYKVPEETPYVPIGARALQNRFRRLARKAHIYIPGRSPHTLRHTYATRLIRAGVNIYVVQRLLGHSSLATTQIYLWASPEELHHAAQKLAAWDFRQPTTSHSLQKPKRYRPSSAKGRTRWHNTREIVARLTKKYSLSRQIQPGGPSGARPSGG